MRIWALALALCVVPSVFAVDVNTINDGANINGGTYLNTPGGVTKFINSQGTGITLEAGQNVRGAEFNNGALTGNGGNIHVDASGQVVKLNGNMDVRGFLPKGSTDNVGNGGNITIDAAFLYQNGNIYAGGLNGGSVQMNVGGMTMGPTSRIDATGQNWINDSFRQVNGIGGNVTINSTGEVNINKGAVVTTNGAAVGLYQGPNDEHLYGNNIVVVGNGVNMNGTLYAGQVHPLDDGGKGTIRISSSGLDADLTIGNGAIVQTDGGSAELNSQRDINQNGLVLANGSAYFNPNPDNGPFNFGVQGYKGGTITLTAVNAVNNTGRIQADGHNSSGSTDHSGLLLGFRGGNGGVIRITAPLISNSGIIRAMGGNASLYPRQDPALLDAGGDGGTVNFIGANPTGNGVVVTMGGTGSTIGKLGTINAPNPAASSNRLYAVWKKSQ